MRTLHLIWPDVRNTPPKMFWFLTALFHLVGVVEQMRFVDIADAGAARSLWRELFSLQKELCRRPKPTSNKRARKRARAIMQRANAIYNRSLVILAREVYTGLTSEFPWPFPDDLPDVDEQALALLLASPRGRNL
jgi:hypothetical protein